MQLPSVAADTDGVAVTVDSGQPLLFLDVDGTVLPRGEPARREKVEDWAAWQSTSNPHLSKIDTTHGARLRAMPCDLIWATAWMHDANKVIAPLLGLPPLAVANLPDARMRTQSARCTGNQGPRRDRRRPSIRLARRRAHRPRSGLGRRAPSRPGAAPPRRHRGRPDRGRPHHRRGLAARSGRRSCPRGGSPTAIPPQQTRITG